MRRLLVPLTAVVLVLGFLHLGLSALVWRHWNIEALWFAGSGLAIVVGGLVNVAMIRVGLVDRVQKTVWLFTNLALASFFALAWPVLKGPQVIVGGLAFALLCVVVVTSAPGRAAPRG